MEIPAVNPCFACDEDWKDAQATFKSVDGVGYISTDSNDGPSSTTSPVSSFQDPFPTVVVRNFLSDPKFLMGLEQYLKSQADFEERNNDLFQFRQTATLLAYDPVEPTARNRAAGDGRPDASAGESSKSSAPNPVEAFGRLLKNVVKPRLEKVSGIELNDHIFMSSSIYEFTDTLLCHDDDLEERRVAFIFYMTPEGWTDADGGQLDLFSCNEDRTPGEVVRSLIPERNSFAFFHVSYKSFHQVREVLARNKTRLSLNGWFHGAPLKRPPPVVEPLSPFSVAGDFPEEDFFSWINPTYLDPDIQVQIREDFEESSEIRLVSFLSEGVYEQLCKAFDSAADTDWKLIGPVNRKRYRRWTGVQEGESMAMIKKLKQLLQSEAFFLVLAQLTGLDLHPLAPSSGVEEAMADSSQDGPSSSKKKKMEEKAGEDEEQAVGNVEIREMSQGCYTLLADNDAVVDMDMLEMSMFFNVPEPPDTDGEGGEDGDEGQDVDGSSDDDDIDSSSGPGPSSSSRARGESSSNANGPDQSDANGNGEMRKEAIDFGGYVSYVPRFEKDEMLRIPPQPNALSMAFRCKDTMRFTKYVNCRIDEAFGKQNAKYQHVFAMYMEGKDAAKGGVPRVGKAHA